MAQTKAIILLGIFILFISSVVFAQEGDLSISPAGKFGGLAETGITHGNYAYLSQGQGLSIIDLTTSPLTQIGSLSLPDDPADMVLYGNYLYTILKQSGGFYAIDISDPSSPDSVAFLEMETLNSAGLYVSYPYIYLAAGPGGFHIIDISSPENPTITSTVNLFYPVDICLSNNKLLAITSSSPAKLRVFDATDPLNPVFRGQVQAPNAVSVNALDNYAYVSCSEYTGGENGLRIFNASDMSNPVETSYYKTQNKAYNTIIDNNQVFLGLNGEMQILNTTQKDSPQLAGQYVMANQEARCIGYTGSNLYIAAKYGGNPLHVVNVSDPSQPGQTQVMTSPGEIISLKVSNQYLYITSFNSLYVYNLNTPERPVYEADFPEFSSLAFLQMCNNNILAGFNWDRLVLIDCTNPTVLSELGSYTLSSGFISHYTIKENKVYIQTSDDNLIILDISDPTNPTELATTALAGDARGIIVTDNYAYSAYSTNSNNIEIFNIASTENITQAGNFSVKSTTTCLWVNNDTLLVGGNNPQGEYVIEAFNISNPTNPVSIAETSGTGKIWDIEVKNDFIMAAVEGGSVIGFMLNIIQNTFYKTAECHSPGSLQITTTPTNDNGNGTLYTSEGTGYMSFPSTNTGKNTPNKTMGTTNSGSKGIVIQNFKTKKPVPKPTLTLRKNTVLYEPVCPDCDSTEITIADLTISVDMVDEWQVQSILFQAWGSGDEFQFVKKAILYVDGSVTDSASYMRDDGTMALSINKQLNPGQSIHLKLTYKFNYPFERTEDHVGEYGVNTSVNMVSAAALNYTNYVMLPPLQFACGPLVVAAVKNVNTGDSFGLIQPAINDNDTENGHTIIVCPGEYKENVVVNKSLNVGSTKGKEYTKITAADSNSAIVRMTKDNSKIHGFTVTYGYWNHRGPAGIHVSGRNTQIYANLMAHGQTGLYMEGADNCLVRDNEFQMNELGIQITGNSSGNTIGGNTSSDKNEFFSNYKDALLLSGSGVSNNTITGNIIGFSSTLNSDNWAQQQNGIHIQNGSSNNQIGGDNSEQRNIISNNSNCGILIENAGSDNNIIQGNYFGVGTNIHTDKPNGYGIGIKAGAKNNTIGVIIKAEEANLIANNSQGGIIIEGEGTDNNAVNQNRILYNSGPGVSITNGAQQTHLYKNELQANTGNGIFISGSGNNHAELNQINETAKNDSSYAGELENGNGLTIQWGKNNNIHDNNIYQNQSTGIVLQNTAENKISKNMLADNKYAGITMSGSAEGGVPAKNEITENVIVGNFRGIEIKDEQTQNLIEKNDINKNDNGLFVSNANDNKIFENKIYSNQGEDNNGHGIAIYNSENTTVGRNIIYENTPDGVMLDNCIENDISINTIYGNGENAITLLNGSNDNKVNSNTVYNNKSGGIVLESSNYNTVENNNSDRNEMYGFALVASSYNKVGHNIVGHKYVEGQFMDIAGQAGLYLDNGANHNIVSHNKVELWANGICVRTSSNNRFNNNYVNFNCSGIQEYYSENNTFINNIVWVNTCLSTGFHIYGSNSIISGNSIKGDEGDGIHCENGATPTINKNYISENAGNGILTESASSPIVYQNNIFNNSKFGVKNADSLITVLATNNWWGDTNGPANSNGVSGTVNFSDWLTEAVDFVLTTGNDTMFVTPGSRDSIFCSLQRWSESGGEFINVTISADDPSWLNSGTDYTLSLCDTLGADTTICFTVPPGAVDGTSNKFIFTAGSGANSPNTNMDSVVVLVYQSYLDKICISPDSITINTGQSVRFRADGTDQKDMPFSFSKTWSATSGTIDSTGLFTADSLEQTVYITATDPVTNKFDKAMILVSSQEQVLTKIIVTPDTVHINPGAAQSFTAQGYDQNDLKISASVQWTADGGTIDNFGNYKADETPGTFMITAKDTTKNITGKAVVIIESNTFVEENPVVPKRCYLYQNYPNPFNPTTTICFDVKEQTRIVLKVHDILGRQVAQLTNAVYQAGSYKIDFDAHNLPSGLYFYKIHMKDFVAVKKMMMLK